MSVNNDKNCLPTSLCGRFTCAAAAGTVGAGIGYLGAWAVTALNPLASAAVLGVCCAVTTLAIPLFKKIIQCIKPTHNSISASKPMQSSQNEEMFSTMTKILDLVKKGRYNRNEALPPELADNVFFMTACVSHDEWMAGLASERLRSNKQFMTYAVSQCGNVIQFVKGDLIFDEDVVSAARRAPDSNNVYLHVSAMRDAKLKSK